MLLLAIHFQLHWLFLISPHKTKKDNQYETFGLMMNAIAPLISLVRCLLLEINILSKMSWIDGKNSSTISEKH